MPLLIPLLLFLATLSAAEPCANPVGLAVLVQSAESGRAFPLAKAGWGEFPRVVSP